VGAEKAGTTLGATGITSHPGASQRTFTAAFGPTGCSDGSSLSHYLTITRAVTPSLMPVGAGVGRSGGVPSQLGTRSVPRELVIDSAPEAHKPQSGRAARGSGRYGLNRSPHARGGARWP